MTTRSSVGLTKGSRFLISFACLVIIIAGLKSAQSIIVPLILAIYIAIISLPTISFFTKKKVPESLAILFVILLDFALIGAFGWIAAHSISELRNEFPFYEAKIKLLEEQVLMFLRGRGMVIDEIPYSNIFQSGKLVAWASFVLGALTGILSKTFLVLIITVLVLLEATHLPGKLREMTGKGETEIMKYGRIINEIQKYLAAKTLLSLTTGIIVSIAALLLGLDFPLLWGLIAFLLDYIPNIGSILAAIPAIMVALLQLGVGPAIVLAGVYLGVNMFLGNIIEPAVVGKRVGLSTLVVLLSLVFWGWLWGVIGMILSLPLTMLLKIIFENSSNLRWVSVMMSPADSPSETAV